MLAAQAVTGADRPYRLHISQAIEAREWDAFVVAIPRGHHVQTGLWAAVKETIGWQSVRLMVSQEDHIIAGAQVLFRSLPLLGKIGFVAKGPYFSVKQPELKALVIAELQGLARKYRIQQLVVQPGEVDKALEQLLLKKGFRPSPLEVSPRATVILDLSPNIGEIMAGINRKTRYNIRLSGRKGITVREGTEADLDSYYQILATTGARKHFSPYPKAYFKAMWRLLRPYGYAQLFIAEYEGEAVSAQLAIPFGDTVINKMSVWNGRYGNRRPNEALQWASIQWAKEQGYRYYDFEGIEPSAAIAIRNGEPMPKSLKQTVTSFKLGFGGQAVLFPAAYDYLYNPLLRWGHTEIFPKVRKNRVVKRLLKRIRTGTG